MSGGMNQQYPPMGGGMGAGGQGGMKPIGTYTSNDSWIPEGSPQFEGGGPIGQPTFGVGMPGGGGWGGGQGDPNRPVPYRPGPPPPPRDRWAGLGQGFSEDQFMRAKSFADRGKMGRARQAIQQGGGQWSPQLHGLLSSPSGQWGNMGWDTMA